ncbi:MAG TPA: ABC transporter permease [Clostridia bacterium]|nr:ABC transporter permease [Clostridia bacterium]
MREIQTNTNFDRLRKSTYVLNSLVKNDIKKQYRNSVLGILWTVLNPLLNMFVMAFVFSSILNVSRSGENYQTYLLTGNIIFGLMRQSTSTSLTSIVDNFGMVTKVKISYSVLPLTRVLTALVSFGFSYIALFIVMLAYKVKFSWTMLLAIPFLPSLLLFSLGMSFILCTFYVYFRDTHHIYGVMLTLWMYMTPLFYYADASILPAKIMKIMQLNPMFHYVKYFRDITMYSTIPGWKETLICYGVGIVFFLIGLLIFKWRRKYFILHI